MWRWRRRKRISGKCDYCRKPTRHPSEKMCPDCQREWHNRHDIRRPSEREQEVIRMTEADGSRKLPPSLIETWFDYAERL